MIVWCLTAAMGDSLIWRLDGTSHVLPQGEVTDAPAGTPAVYGSFHKLIPVSVISSAGDK